MPAGPMRLPTTPLKLAIVVLAAAAVILSAGASSARAGASVSVSFHGHLRGTAYFDGFEFKICDRRKDGLPVAVRYSYFSPNGPVRRTQWHKAGVAGAGRPRVPGQFVFGCSYGSAPLIGNAKVVWLQACVRHERGFLQCSKVQKTRGPG